jgi:hypothetical protein
MTFRYTIYQNNYDSVLEPAGVGRPAKLTIGLKVVLSPRGPPAPGNPAGAQHPVHLVNSMAQASYGQIPDGDTPPRLVNCRSWLVPEWDQFKIDFKQAVERSWNDQIFLLPPEGQYGDALSDEDYRQLIGNPRIAAHVECALDIQLMNSVGHAEIEVVHLKQPGLLFRNEMHLISDESTKFKVRHWHGASLYQVPAAHEVGHWLHSLTTTAFEHIDRQFALTLPAAQQDDAEYGHVLSKRRAQMGSGNLATAYEAEPWLVRIARHTHAPFGWTMVHRLHFRPQPLPARQQRLIGP